MNRMLGKLENFLSKRCFIASRIEALTPDASTRSFFRVWTESVSVIVCVYPDDELGRTQFNAYLDVTNLFLKANLPVARIISYDESSLIIAHEDFGDLILRDKLDLSDEKEREEIFDKAIALIAKIQAATALAHELNSVASRLRFDTEKLFWELNFFKTHYFSSLLKSPLSKEEDEKLSEEFLSLSRMLDARAMVLTHRDYHLSNLMFFNDEIKIIDHQDARIGSVSYDLVSLLLDRITEIPSEKWLSEKRKIFLEERRKLGFEDLNEEDFIEEFHLQSIQRCLKAVGTFSYQIALRGKSGYSVFIKPMINVVLRACQLLGVFPFLREKLSRSLQ
ncbi:MAG: phosphotransferase [Pyrinomonadaceae bacterium]|nr:phosphotransferase [Pyrinomonadaceae bacterium]MCX7638891.1 phosphotransferase [Pyrinomonadaceae bacterium]MDW8304972.1 phosphotransferase [Acidobacteriota bacterium]